MRCPERRGISNPSSSREEERFRSIICSASRVSPRTRHWHGRSEWRSRRTGT
jgi:hypothetical protein